MCLQSLRLQLSLLGSVWAGLKAQTGGSAGKGSGRCRGSRFWGSRVSPGRCPAQGHPRHWGAVHRVLTVTNVGQTAHSPSAAEPGETKPFWLQQIPLQLRLHLRGICEKCWAELGALCSLGIKPPRTSGLPSEPLQVRNRATHTKITCEHSGQQQELLVQLAKALVCIYLWLNFRDRATEFFNTSVRKERISLAQ